MNIGKFLVKVIKNIYHNCAKVAHKILQEGIASKKGDYFTNNFSTSNEKMKYHRKRSGKMKDEPNISFREA